MRREKRRRDDGNGRSTKRPRIESTTVAQLRAEIHRQQGEMQQLRDQCRVLYAHILRAYAHIATTTAAGAAAPHHHAAIPAVN